MSLVSQINDLATRVATEIKNHLTDTSDAHNASAISVVPAGTIAATDVQDAIEELDDSIAYHDTHRVYDDPTGDPAGYDTLIDLDYDATSGAIPESVMVRAWNESDVLTKAFWLNEAGQPRVWTVFKDEPALKLFAFGENGEGNVLTVQDRWDAGVLRWAINGKGQVVLGDDETVGGSVVVLTMDDDVPVDLPENTIVIRRGDGGGENLLSNRTFKSSITNWTHAADGLTWQSGAGQDEAGFAQMTASSTGNRNIQAKLIPASPGDILSVDGYVKWVTGTPKDMSVMIRFLDSGGSQLENNVGTLVTPGTGAWSLISSLNADAPSGTVNAQIQVRINSAATSDVVNLDNFWVNHGATIDRSDPDPGIISIWNGSSEILVWDGSAAGGTPAASDVTYDATGGSYITSSDVQGALQEADASFLDQNGLITGHISDTTNAHNASAIFFEDSTTDITGDDVQEIVENLDTALSGHISDSTAAHAASAISYAGGTGMSATTVEAAIDELATEKTNTTDFDTLEATIDDHISDSTAAHAASAVSFSPTGTIAATTVQAAIAEVASEAQPLDSDLTAIAALTTTSYGRALLALADQAALTAALANGTTSLPGSLELATTAEALAGTDTARAMTPANVLSAHGAVQNIYVPSTAAVHLDSATEPHKIIEVGSGATATIDILNPVIGREIVVTIGTSSGSVVVWDDSGDTSYSWGHGKDPSYTISQYVSTTLRCQDVIGATGYWVEIARTEPPTQPLDSDLTSIAALSTTSYGRALLTLANQAALTALNANATTSLPGIIELATAGEVTTGTDAVRAVTPATLYAANSTLETNIQTGTTYTLAITDAGKVVQGNHASGITITIPAIASVSIPVGSWIEIYARGAGPVTISAATVTMNCKTNTSALTSFVIPHQFGLVRLWHRASDTWVLTGDVTPNTIALATGGGTPAGTPSGTIIVRY